MKNMNDNIKFIYLQIQKVSDLFSSHETLCIVNNQIIIMYING